MLSCLCGVASFRVSVATKSWSFYSFMLVIPVGSFQCYGGPEATLVGFVSDPVGVLAVFGCGEGLDSDFLKL